MEILNKRLSLHEFRDYLKTYDFGSVFPDKLVLHHTWRPTKVSWAGEKTIAALKRHYEGKGWPAGPHLFVAEDGIWLFSPMNKDGIHAGRLNKNSIGIEVVGDYDADVWSGSIKANALGAIQMLMDRLDIGLNGLFFHRDASAKSCPGWSISKEWLVKEISTYRLKPAIPKPVQFLNKVKSISAPISKIPLPHGTEKVVVPAWAKEAVAFVRKHNLFQIQTNDDVRDAVKFYRFYQLIDSEFYEE